MSRRMNHMLSLVTLACVAGMGETSGPVTVQDSSPGSTPRVPDMLPIRFERAHGTASASHYAVKPGTRQRKRRKAARQRVG